MRILTIIIEMSESESDVGDPVEYEVQSVLNIGKGDDARNLLAVAIQIVYAFLTDDIDDVERCSRLALISAQASGEFRDEADFIGSFHRTHLYTTCFTFAFEESLRFLRNLLEGDQKHNEGRFQGMFKSVFLDVVGKVISRRGPAHFVASDASEDDIVKAVEPHKELYQGCEDEIRRSVTDNDVLDADDVSARVWRKLGLRGELRAAAQIKMDGLPRMSVRGDPKGFVPLSLARRACLMDLCKECKPGLFVPVNLRRLKIVACEDSSTGSRENRTETWGDSGCRFAKMHPIEFHILRLLHCGEEQQRLVIVDSLANLLFPCTPVGASRRKAWEFASNVIRKLADNHLVEMALRNTRFFRYVVRMFSMKDGMELVLSGNVWEPLSSKFLLRPFLFDPSLSERLPVIYAFLRLNERFDLVRILGSQDLVHGVHRLIESETPTATLNSLKDFEGFQKEWSKACSYCQKEFMTKQACDALQKTLTNPQVQWFKWAPSKLTWEDSPVVNVLISLSNAHNEFVTTLARYCSIRTVDVSDERIWEDVDSVCLDGYAFGSQLVKIVRDSVGNCGRPVFTEEHEEKFRWHLSHQAYHFIVHSSLLSQKIRLTTTENPLFELGKRYGCVALTHQQRKVLREEVSQNYHLGVALLMERIAYYILSRRMRVSKTESILNFITNHQLDSAGNPDDVLQKMLLTEREAYENGFLNANSKSPVAFTIAQMPEIYKIFTTSSVDNPKEPDEASVSQIVVDLLAKRHSLGDCIGMKLPTLDSNDVDWTVVRANVLRFMLFMADCPEKEMTTALDSFKKSDFMATMVDSEKEVFETFTEPHILRNMEIGWLQTFLEALDKRTNT